MDNEKIGNFIREKRKEKGMTQQDLGDIVGVGFKAVSKWENGVSIPDISILKKICEIFDCSVDELLDGKKKDEFKYKNKNKNIIKKYIKIFCIFLIVIILIFLYIIFNKQITGDSKDSKGSSNFDCVLTKTYNINNINDSNDENYLYITFSQYQEEGVYTIKLSKSVSKNLEIGKNYEFTFNTNKEYIHSTPDLVFENSELINIVDTEKVGVEQTNEFICK